MNVQFKEKFDFDLFVAFFYFALLTYVFAEVRLWDKNQNIWTSILCSIKGHGHTQEKMLPSRTLRTSFSIVCFFLLKV